MNLDIRDRAIWQDLATVYHARAQIQATMAASAPYIEATAQRWRMEALQHDANIDIMMMQKERDEQQAKAQMDNILAFKHMTRERRN